MLKIVFLPKATLYEMFKVTIIKSSEFKYPFCLKKKKHHRPLVQLNTNTGIILSLIRTLWGQQYNHRMKRKPLSSVCLCVIVQSMEFSRPEHWSGQPLPTPEDRPNPGIEPRSPILQADFYQGSPIIPESYPKSWSVCSNKLKQKTKMDLSLKTVIDLIEIQPLSQSCWKM